MSTEDIDKIVRNAIHLQHSISKQINTMSSNNLELSEIIEDIPSAINSLTSDTCNKIIEQHNVQLQNNLTKSLEQINEQINQLRYSSKVI